MIRVPGSLIIPLSSTDRTNFTPHLRNKRDLMPHNFRRGSDKSSTFDIVALAAQLYTVRAAPLQRERKFLKEKRGAHARAKSLAIATPLIADGRRLVTSSSCVNLISLRRSAGKKSGGGWKRAKYVRAHGD